MTTVTGTTSKPAAMAGRALGGAARASAFRRALPNALTGSRVVIAGVFFVMLIVWRFDGSPSLRGGVDWLLLVSAALFCVATLTDALDGYLARRWQVESLFGRIMDPFADKILIVGALVFLAGPDFWWRFPDGRSAEFTGHGVQVSGVYPWMVVLIFAREFLVTSIRGVLEGQGIDFGADRAGKIKMIVQSVCVPTILVTVAITSVLPGGPGAETPWGRWVVDISAWVMVIVTTLSGIPYVTRCGRLLAEKSREKRAAQEST